MTNEALIGIILTVSVVLGGFIVWFVNWLKGLIRSEISRYDNHVKDEKIKDLQEDNRRLREHAANTK